MMHYLENHLLSSAQFGFLRKKCTTLQLLDCLNFMTEHIDSGVPIDVVLLDLQKAFDSVVHSKLLAKLRAYGIAGHVLTWITSFLTNRQQRVKVNSSFSQWSAVLSGVPQGSILDPLLFILYINDAPDSIGSGFVRLFADDTKLLKPITGAAACADLQSNISQFFDWCNRWQITINRKNQLLYMWVGTTPSLCIL